ncbi:MAG: alginate export family protein [Planctomycetota bacterium]
MNRSLPLTRLGSSCLALGLCAAAPLSLAQTNDNTPTIADDVPTSLQEAMSGGKVKLNVRARAEIVDQDNLDTAQAYTVRTRLGYLTKDFGGFTGYVELEDVRAADDDLFNDGPGESTAGLSRAVVADPNVTELNEAWLQYTNKELAGLKVKAGRQVIALDDQRFVGHVGWRQDNQTFDSVRAWTNLGIDGLDVTAGFIGKVNRIFGEEADFDDTNASFVNGSFKIPEVGKLTVFGYFFDLGTESVAAPNSNNTFGVRLAGSKPLGDSGMSLAYAGSFATQSDTGDNPVDYTAQYYAVDLGLKVPEYGTFGVGYEVLGSDDGNFGFRTPLATLHKFNGFADVFLVTPNDGLEDLYVYYGIPFPKEWKMKGKIVYHYFSGNESIGDLGQELDAVFSKKLADNLTLLCKVALFDGKEANLTDRNKVTVDLTFAF